MYWFKQISVSKNKIDAVSQIFSFFGAAYDKFYICHVGGIYHKILPNEILRM